MKVVDPRYFRGKVVKIHSLVRVEVLLELAFDVALRRRFSLAQLDFTPEKLDPETYSKAQHALVVLLGGKRVVVEPVGPRAKWGQGETSARVYLDCRNVRGNPVGLTQDLLQYPVLETSAFFSWLSKHDFDLDIVKRILNGDRRG